MMHSLRNILITMLAAAGLTAHADAQPDYDSLSHVSSEQLMENGRRHFERREPKRALACFIVVGERYKKDDSNENIQMSIRALNNAACVYKYFYFDYSRAYEYFTRAYDLCEEYRYGEFLPVIMVNLGDLLNDYGQSYDSQTLSKQANDLFNHCMDYAVSNKQWELLTTAFFNLASQNYQLPLKQYKAIFLKEIPDSTPDIRYVRLQYKALEQLQQGRYAKARQLFQQQLSTVTARWEPERDTLATLMAIAYTYRMERDYTQETQWLEQAYWLAGNSHLADQAPGICKLLAASYGQQGDTERQQLYRQKYLELKEETDQNRLVNIGEMNYIYQLRKEQAHATEMHQRHVRQQWIFFGMACILVILSVSAVLLWRKNRQLYLRTRQLYEKYRQMLAMERETQLLRKKDFEKREHKTARKQEGEREKDAAKYSRSTLSTEQKEALLYRIEQIMSTPEVISQPDFNLNKLAKLAESNTSYISQVINEHYGQTFTNTLASFRIKEACRRLSDETGNYSHLTIEAISATVGFRSRTSFTSSFKREVGITPSEYFRIANKKEKK